jgi:hypothetical protein
MKKSNTTATTIALLVVLAAIAIFTTLFLQARNARIETARDKMVVACSQDNTTPECKGRAVIVTKIDFDAVPEWSGACDPDNYWIDDKTDERVCATTGERSQHQCPVRNQVTQA